MDQFDPAADLETFWTNLYLRGRLLHDPIGSVASGAYNQPYAGIPGARSWVIGPDQKIILPHFGHDPALMIAIIYNAIAANFVAGDRDGDGDIDWQDYDACAACLSGPGDPYAEANCRLFDFDDDGDVDCADYQMFEAAFLASSGFTPVMSVEEFVACILGTTQDAAGTCLADINKDGINDGRDIPPYVANALLTP